MCTVELGHFVRDLGGLRHSALGFGVQGLGICF